METFDLTSETDRLALVERVFVYPTKPHKRKHGPAGYVDYESYRDWLRDEFSYRCVFSLLRESWPQTRFHIDHFISQKERPDLVCEYDNLILLEGRLNLVKGKRRVPNPCLVALGDCLLVHTNGQLMGCIEARNGNKIGEQIIRILRLDSDDATQVRRDWIGILRSTARTDEQLFRKFVGYPKNLPDLRRANTQNIRKNGLNQSAKCLRDVGKLTDWY
ncbi:MAG TPA: hypothetical protein VG347_01760 [Verrucomicrobiae bacterium]|nr:hypothetical protein [Verrucomicrobiae bacterium]